MPWSPGVVGKAGRVWLPSFLLLSGGGRMWVRDKALIADRALHFLEHPSTKTTNGVRVPMSQVLYRILRSINEAAGL